LGVESTSLMRGRVYGRGPAYEHNPQMSCIETEEVT
jgi:hypothetical protein